MKVTPVRKKFGKYAPGDEFEFPDQTAKVFIRIGKLAEVKPGLVYQTRMMTAQLERPVEAPYGLKADGTPKARPGRSPAPSNK